jgi:hypothetical protein
LKARKLCLATASLAATLLSPSLNDKMIQTDMPVAKLVVRVDLQNRVVRIDLGENRVSTVAISESRIPFTSQSMLALGYSLLAAHCLLSLLSNVARCLLSRLLLAATALPLSLVTTCRRLFL